LPMEHFVKTSCGALSTQKYIVFYPYHVYVIPITTLSAGQNAARRSNAWQRRAGLFVK
jgi:hypothetical protein